MASNLVRRARQLLDQQRPKSERGVQKVAQTLAREFPHHERHEVWGAVGYGPGSQPAPLYLEHVNPHEVRTRVDPRPDTPPEHVSEAEANQALRDAGVKRPRRPRKPTNLSWLSKIDDDDPSWASRLAGEPTDAERAASEARVKAERAAADAASAAERAKRQADKAAHLARRSATEARAARASERATRKEG